MPSENKQKHSSPITLIYLLSTGIVTILSNMNEESDILKYMKLDYKKIINNFELWRLITTFLYIGKPSPKLIFNYFLYYKRMKSTEKKYLKNKKLSEFIMLLIYLMILSHISNFIAYLFFKFKPNSFLSNQLMFSIILINSKRNPEKMFKFYWARIPNKFVPYFLFTMRTIRSKKIMKNLISFIPGISYYYLKDVIPKINNNFDLLVTPKYLDNFCRKYFYSNHYSKKKKIKNKIVDKENNEKNKNNNDDGINKKLNYIINKNKKAEKYKYD